uniref:Transmembrane protein n=1 Tax=Meloidogyne javanica TaxID=6303 RepID=A0A915LWQ6_MELJA
QQKKHNGEQRHSVDEHCLLLPRLEDEHCFAVVVDDGGGGEDCLLDALLTDPPTTTAEDTTTKAATSTTPKKEAPRKGMFANAMSGLENLARRRHDPYDDLTPKERKEMEEAAPFVIVFFVIMICCCCACIVGVVALTIKAVSKKEKDERETAPKNM